MWKQLPAYLETEEHIKARMLKEKRFEPNIERQVHHFVFIKNLEKEEIKQIVPVVSKNKKVVKKQVIKPKIKIKRKK